MGSGPEVNSPPDELFQVRPFRSKSPDEPKKPNLADFRLTEAQYRAATKLADMIITIEVLLTLSIILLAPFIIKLITTNAPTQHEHLLTLGGSDWVKLIFALLLSIPVWCVLVCYICGIMWLIINHIAWQIVDPYIPLERASCYNFALREFGSREGCRSALIMKEPRALEREARMSQPVRPPSLPSRILAAADRRLIRFGSVLSGSAKEVENFISRSVISPASNAARFIGWPVAWAYKKVVTRPASIPREERPTIRPGEGPSMKSPAIRPVEIKKEVTTSATPPEPPAKAPEIPKSPIVGHSLVRVRGPANTQPATVESRIDFGDVSNDDPSKLDVVAARIRRGQPAFRQNLMAAYGGRCVISNHGPEEVLEAVHILPHATTGINELDNGLLMRADIYSLFDAGLITIDPLTLVVTVNPLLQGTPYMAFNGTALRPREDGTQPDSKYLTQRWAQIYAITSAYEL